MATIAKAAGVSQGAISSLLNNRDYGIRVSEKTKEKVFKICRELGYVPNDFRAVVRIYPEVGDICVLVSDSIQDSLLEPFYARMITSLMKAGAAGEGSVTIARFSSTADYSQSLEALPQPLKTGVASKFISVGTPNLSLLQTILKRGLPVATVGHELNHPGVTSFMPDFSEASRLGVEYLFGLGHQNIAILSGPFGSSDPAIIEMNQGIKAAFDAAGKPIDPQNIIYGDLTFKTGYETAENLFGRSSHPTALFCLSDTAGRGDRRRAAQGGLPRQVQRTRLLRRRDLHADLPRADHSPHPGGRAGHGGAAGHRGPHQERGPHRQQQEDAPGALVERNSCAPLEK
ncbi:MAG: LacI family DNA-binding transcriptional regulator [Chthoniobacteraceae bacterium]